jgi:hypothetical protein
MRLQAAILAFVAVTAPAFAAESAPPAPAAAAAAPKAVVPELRHDFGVVAPNDVLRHTFEVRNEGTAPLLLEKVAANCKCTALEFDREIAPQATGKVIAAVDTRMVEGPSVGEITVDTNDPAMPRLVLRTQVDVRSKLLAKPGYARWNMVQGEKEGVIKQILWSVDGADFHVLGIKAPTGVRTSFRPATGDELRKDVKGAQWYVETTLATTAPVGAVEGFVEVMTDHPVQPSMRIPVSGFVRPVVHVTPPQANLGTISLGEGAPRKAVFHVQNFATEKIAVVSAETTLKRAKVVIKPIEEGRAYNVEVELDPRMPAGPFSGALRIKTDSARAPLVEVPISGAIAPATAAAH